jgi:thioredoxin reductase (NADPH)
MAQQVLLAVDNDGDILAAIQRDLSRRFATDYRIVAGDSRDAAMAKLEADAEVAVAMAGQWLTDTMGLDFLGECRQRHPAAKRLLLITHGDFAAGQAALRAKFRRGRRPCYAPTWPTVPGTARESTLVNSSPVA